MRLPLLRALLFSAAVIGTTVLLPRLAESVIASEDETTVREVELTAAPVQWEIQPGLVVEGWGYNGQVPGPELRFKEGERVRVHLRNQLPVPTTIHWHGLDVPLDQDGVPGLSQPLVQPGADFTYEFVASNPGTRWYHTHVSENLQQELGLYGALIIEPREPATVQYDREFTYVLDEKALDVTPAVALGQAQIRHRESGNGHGGQFLFDLFLMNGKAGDAIPPMHGEAGERIRLRLINAGSLPHAMHLHGQSFKIVATDGNPVPEAAQLVKDTVLLGPGERYDLEVVAVRPGVWLFHCHMPNHMENGMVTTMVYEGFDVPHLDHGHMAPPHAPTESAALPTPSPGHGAHTGAVPSTSQKVAMLDDRFEAPSLTVSVGTTVRWENDGFNLHTASSFDGSFDTGTLASGESSTHTFNTLGSYRYYCRQHILGGMLGTITVQ